MENFKFTHPLTAILYPLIYWILLKRKMPIYFTPNSLSLCSVGGTPADRVSFYIWKLA